MTFKEFYWYSLKIEAEEEREWVRQSQMMWLHAQMNAPKGKRLSPDQFNPFSAQNKGPTPKNSEKVIDLKERILARQKATQK